MTAPISYSLKSAAQATGLSVSHLKRAIGAGELRAKRSAEATKDRLPGKYVIRAADLQAYVDGLVDA